MKRTDYIKAKTYKGQKIKGMVHLTLKIDGVRILYRDGDFVTRNNKIPAGLDIALTDKAKEKLREYKDCEVYCGDFFSSNSPLQQHNPEPSCITEDHIYPLLDLDPRLDLGYFTECPEPEYIWDLMRKANKSGYEGLVIHARDKELSFYRVKPQAYADVRITSYFEQLDKNKQPKDILGGFETNYGKVTAFTQKQREELWRDPESHIGKMITVRYKERYHTGNFRYAVKFESFRDDKDEESFDTQPPEK